MVDCTLAPNRRNSFLFMNFIRFRLASERRPFSIFNYWLESSTILPVDVQKNGFIIINVGEWSMLLSPTPRTSV